ncbi:FRG domain-containing protein [Rathayibacter sp. PhB151]|uniref:FRG domain-containing protein n=1 Tax=Rathayibacter sp. PhB151 TaxID=2485189 RepID=UPI0010EA932F|nr:FRG domain-containing protein [Rathayibacter sp. PhB151]TDX81555.1 FRG domain-containing protein [Rathayibacter sp. PhB151]
MTRSGFSTSAFFTERELNKRLRIQSLDDLWTLLVQEQNSEVGEDTKLRKLTASTLLFRGQSDEAYGLSTSLHRALRADVTASLSESSLIEAETRIRDRVTAMGIGRGLDQLQLQQLLQHHHAPTRLLDVSRTPMEALFFATEDRDRTDGRLFVVHVVEGGSASLDVNETELPWARFPRGEKNGDSSWTRAVNVIEGGALDPRMFAQNGVFLVGGLRRDYGENGLWIGKTRLNVEEIQAVSMLNIGFPKRYKIRARKMTERETTSSAAPDAPAEHDGDSVAKGNRTLPDRPTWPAYAWTIRIPAEWKGELRRKLLDELTISHRHMYPALESIKWESEAAVRL